MKIAVLSDLHIYDATEAGGGVKPSYLDAANINLRNSTNPLASLHDLIAREGLEADYVVCPGDIADKASPSALQIGWSALHDLSKRLGAEELLVTNGNHDIDSRFQASAFDAKGVLLSLAPYFPIDDLGDANFYWARNYVICERDGCRFLLINSAAYHGYSGRAGSPEKEPEYTHGRISSWTIDAIVKDLAGRSVYPVNIAVFHHHPIRHHGITYQDYSEMEGGGRLLEALTNATCGEWILIHGHKHIPRLAYAGGGAEPPFIFCAGSFSATLMGEIAQTKNQFYILDVDNKNGIGGLTLCGAISAWDWAPAVGWSPAIQSGGICARAGFGYRGSLQSLAQQVDAYMKASGHRILRRAEMSASKFTAEVPGLLYVLPADFKKLDLALEKMEITLAREASGEILEIVRVSAP